MLLFYFQIDLNNNFIFFVTLSLISLLLQSSAGVLKCATSADFTVSCASSGGEWTVLSEEVTDSCYVVKDLPRGASYVFRMGCITKTGAGPFSDASAPVVMATHPEGNKNTLKHDDASNVLQFFI